MNNKGKSSYLITISIVVFLIALITYFYVLFFPFAKFLYKMNYVKAIILMISLSLIVFSIGLIKNNKNTYKTNVVIYTILYLILLISITIFIGRIDVKFRMRNLTRFNTQFLVPFRSISMFLKQNVSMKTKIHNLGGNMIMLMPLSLLLIMNDDKYKKILNQIKIILPVSIFIELLQEFTGTGALDIDDIILNFVGAIIFSILITRFNICDKIKKLFYSDFNFNIKIKYLILIISNIIPIGFVISIILKW